MERGNVIGSRRPEAPENRRKITGGEERAARKHECPPIARLLPDSDQLPARDLNLVTSLETLRRVRPRRARDTETLTPEFPQYTWGVLPRDTIAQNRLITNGLITNGTL